MRKITNFISWLAVVSTIITLFIVYRNIYNDYTYKFVAGYVIFLLLAMLYFIFVTMINVTRLKWQELRQRLVKFAVCYIVLFGINFVIHHGLKPSEVHAEDFLAMPLGLSLGYFLFDLSHWKRKNKIQRNKEKS